MPSQVHGGQSGDYHDLEVWELVVHEAREQNAKREFQMAKATVRTGAIRFGECRNPLQTADILTKAFTNAAKWEHALRLIGIGQKLADSPVQAGAPTRTVVSKVLQQGGVAHANTHDRLLIEFCCSADSKLGQMRSESKGCKVLRVTINEDATTSKCMKWIDKEINTFKQQHPKAKVLLYGSLPCTGGSPWGNVNKQTEEGLERIKEQQKEFTKLLELRQARA